MIRFSSKNTIKVMNRLPIIQGQNIFGTTVRFSIKWMIEFMDRLAIIQAQKVVQRTV